MGIPDEDVAQVRAATDIVALIGEHAALKRVGRRWTGLCPFHTEKSPSFSVNAEEGFYYCFGCQASGDAITFVRAMEHLDFVDAVRLLADRAGVALHEDAEAGKDRKRRTDLLDAMERAVVWYHERLLRAPDAGPARDYLRSRGYDGEVVRQFRLGWAPDEWDALSRALEALRAGADRLGAGFHQPAGAGPRTPSGPGCSSRSAIPRDDRWPSAAGSSRPDRVSRRRSGPSRSTRTPRRRPIYSKRRTLYALNWAKQDVIAQGEVVVCEGYTDVIGFFQAGVPRAVATCGTALAEEHFTLLRNFGRRIVLAYDADGAGQSATSRVYEWERRHEVDVVVADLPSGSDPGTWPARDPGRPGPGRGRSPTLPAVPGRPHPGRGRPDHGGGPGPGRRGRPDARWPSTPTISSVTSTSCSSRTVAGSTPPRLRERLEHLRASTRRAEHPPSRPRHVRPTAGTDGDPGELRDPDDDGDEWDDGSTTSQVVVHKSRPRARSVEIGRAPARRGGGPAAAGAVRRPAAARGLHGVGASTTTCTTPSRRPHPRWQGCCAGSPWRSRSIGDPEFGDPVDLVVGVLLREAVRRALSEVEKASRGLDESWQAGAAVTAQVRHWLAELEDPGPARTRGRSVGSVAHGAGVERGMTGPEWCG